MRNVNPTTPKAEPALRLALSATLSLSKCYAERITACFEGKGSDKS